MWREPKMDWQSSYDTDGNYTGDYFNVDPDYIRITENLEYLHELSILLYPDYDFVEMEDITMNNDLYKELFNNIEYNTIQIAENTFYDPNIEPRKTWVGNGKTPIYDDYNRLEKNAEIMYNNLEGEYNGLITLEFTLGGERF